MTTQRWNDMMNDQTACLTNREMEEGWHWCFGGWDGLLVGPGMREFAYCECEGLDEQKRNDRHREEYELELERMEYDF